MKTRILVIAGLAFGLMAAGAAAQHEGHHADQAAPETKNPGAGMMQSGMKAQMSRVMMSHAETSMLVDQLLGSLAAIEAERNPAALQSKLAEHEALLRQLQTDVQAQADRMQTMHHMMSGTMMNKEDKK